LKSVSQSDSKSPIECLDSLQLDKLMESFEVWYHRAPTPFLKRVRGRYWLSFLMLRFTGARVGEILRVDDSLDIDFENHEIRICDRLNVSPRRFTRTVPVPSRLIAQIRAYLTEFPMMRGKVFALDQGNFRREFYRRAEDAQIPRDLSHPHILRHTRAREMVLAGVPIKTIQGLLGHAAALSTVIYLQVSETAPGKILKEKGLL